jgi:hypothetical protein
MQQFTWLKNSIAVMSMLGLFIAAASAQAVPRSMTGSLGVINPSTLSPFYFEAGPGLFGKAMGAYPPSDGFKTISVTGLASTTMVGKQVTLPANVMNFSGTQVRSFPNFANVANLTKTFMSVQDTAMFSVGGGALDDCPGPGCTGVNGSGTAISFCPPLAHNPLAPAPGVNAAQIGQWNCKNYALDPGAATRGIRIQITNSVGAPHFGGTLSVLRNDTGNVWRVLAQSGTTTPTPAPAEVSRSWMQFTNFAWTPGRPNFEYTSNPGNPGPRLLARLNANGAVTQTSGCVAAGGNPGGSFMVGVPIPNAGTNCGTPAVPDPPGLGWGFKMTTGTIAGSDFYPFLDATTAAGTPFAPNFVQLAYLDGFFFTRMGTDEMTGGGNRNIVLLGGGLAGDPSSTNNFFRISDLRLTLQVPEPAMGFGLVAGVMALVAVARRRS